MLTDGDNDNYRRWRNIVAWKIAAAKSSFYEGSLRDLRTTDPSRWHKGIQVLSNKLQSPPVISVPNIPDGTDEEIANAINVTFASTAQSRPPLMLDKLPSYLPAQEPPHVEPYQMFEKLRRVESRKAIGPDNIPNKLIRDFACESSVPIADIFSCSL